MNEPYISNVSIAFEAGEAYAMECHAGLHTMSAMLACEYESEEMKKAFEAGYNHFFHHIRENAMEELIMDQRAEEMQTMYDEWEDEELRTV